MGNIITISKARLGSYIGEIDKNDMLKIDDAIIKSMGLSYKFNKLMNEYNNKVNHVNNLYKKIDRLQKEIKDLKK